MEKPALETKHRGLLMLALMMVSIIQFIDITIANVALPHMQSSLGANLDTISWVLTTFIIATVLTTPVVGWVADTFGSRRVFLLAVCGFLLASMLCGLASSLEQMVLFRALQGICAAFIAPMGQTALLDINPPSKQPAAMTIWGMVVMIAPITGPMLGGYLTETLSWRWVFFVNLPLGIPTLLLLVWLLPSRPITERRLDRFGCLTLAIALGSLQLLLDRGQHKDWFQSWEIIIELVVALSVFWIFAIHTRTTKHPLFPAELLKDSNFIGAFSIMFILGVANVAIASVLPTIFQNVYGYSPFDTGLLLIPRAVAVMLSMALSTRLMSYIQVRYLIAVGFLISAVGLHLMAGWSIDMGSWPICSAGFVQGFGLGLIFSPITIAAYSTLPQQYRPDGASLLNLMRNLGGSFGISIIFTMISRNTQVSHVDLTSHVTAFSVPLIDPAATASRFGDMGSGALAMIDAEISRQALMIAYLDNFYALSILISCIGAIALLLKPMRVNNDIQPTPAK